MSTRHRNFTQVRARPPVVHRFICRRSASGSRRVAFVGILDYSLTHRQSYTRGRAHLLSPAGGC